MNALRKPLLILGAFVALWLGLKFLLPVALPFLLGGMLAVAAEPAVRFGQRVLKWKRGLSAGFGVTVTLVFLLGALSILGAAAVKELGQLASFDVEGSVNQGLEILRSYLSDAAGRAPQGVRPVLERTVENFFDDGTAVMEGLSRKIPGAVSSALGWVPDGLLGIGTGVLAAFFLSARLPRLKIWLSRQLEKPPFDRIVPMMKRVRKALGGWLSAQLKLAAVTYGILAAGFLLLGISYGFLWALPVAVVDAVPLLGTGTVLVPWALVCLLQGNNFRFLGLLAVYAATAVTRTVLEPRWVGKQLGLDPLVTLGALYAGYRVWGFLGLVIAPMAAAAVKSVLSAGQETLPAEH